jgi:hypothetical protein
VISVNRLGSSAIILTDHLEGLLKFVCVDCVKGPSYVEMDDGSTARKASLSVRRLPLSVQLTVLLFHCFLSW